MFQYITSYACSEVIMFLLALQLRSCSSNSPPRLGDGHCEFFFPWAPHSVRMKKGPATHMLSSSQRRGQLWFLLFRIKGCHLFAGHGSSEWICWGLHRGKLRTSDFIIRYCKAANQNLTPETWCNGGSGGVNKIQPIAFLKLFLGYLRRLFLYLQAIIKKRPQRNINVQNFYLYVFGMIFNAVAIVIQDFDEVANKYVVSLYALL